MLASQLAQELTAHNTIRNFVGMHPALIGAYAEASVIQFIKRIVFPLRVSTGTIIYEGNVGKKPPQLDIIIWSPAPVPAVFENGDYAIVPRGSAHGFIEIKSTDYSSSVKDISTCLDHESELIQPKIEGYRGALGIVCLAQKKTSKIMRDLIADNRGLILLKQEGDHTVPNPDGVWTLINFLAHVRLRASAIDGRLTVNHKPTSNYSIS